MSPRRASPRRSKSNPCYLLTERTLQTTEDMASALIQFRDGKLSSGQAAKLAHLTLAEFLEYASGQGIDVVSYDPAELDQELAAFSLTVTRK
jgi:predicted HTH domain antitoxin